MKRDFARFYFYYFIYRSEAQETYTAVHHENTLAINFK